jgi:hypothetical protein
MARRKGFTQRPQRKELNRKGRKGDAKAARRTRTPLHPLRFSSFGFYVANFIPSTRQPSSVQFTKKPSCNLDEDWNYPVKLPRLPVGPKTK